MKLSPSLFHFQPPRCYKSNSSYLNLLQIDFEVEFIDNSLIYVVGLGFIYQDSEVIPFLSLPR